ncbi:MAG: DUF3035 domain-containing protein [Rubricella sp.]
MTHKAPFRVMLAVLAFGGLAACSGGDVRDEDRTIIQEIMDRDSGPDEFLVISRQPLIIPTDSGASLPAPTPGARSPLLPDSGDALRAALGGSPTAGAEAREITAGEGALLASAGATGLPGNVRQLIAADHDQRMSSEENFLGVLFDEPLFPPYASHRLDAVAELERLRGLYPQGVLVTPDPARFEPEDDG